MGDRDILSRGAASLGITLDDRMLDSFGHFTHLLLEWNERLNLTRITDPAEIVVKHYLDSIAVLKYAEIPEGARLIDVGTGAGLPGIPLRIVIPNLRLTLLDSVRKKLAFLEAAVEELRMSDVEFVHSRAEDLGRAGGYREKYDFAVSRAVARMSVLSELCIPFCKVGGRFVAYKGPDAGEEIEESRKAIRLLGGEIEAVHSFVLPETDLGRTLIVVRKIRPTPPRYPRKAGIPEKEPL